MFVRFSTVGGEKGSGIQKPSARIRSKVLHRGRQLGHGREQSLHQVTILFSDRGTPRGFRHANGYFSHTFSLVNAQGQRAWCKWHFRTMQGIERGEFPKWRVCVQIMDDGQASAFPYNPFDLTKVSPQKQFPLHVHTYHRNGHIRFDEN
jgi:catalase